MTLPLVSQPKDVWETSVEIPYWWSVTTQIWVVPLIGWIKFPTRHDQSEALPRSTTQIWLVTRQQYGISALVSQTTFGGQTSGSVAKCRLFYQANLTVILQCFALVWLTVLPRLANARCKSFSCWCFFGGNTANIALTKLSPVNVKLSWVIMIQEGPQTLISITRATLIGDSFG